MQIYSFIFKWLQNTILILKKYLVLNFYIMDLPILCIMWLICDGYGSGSTKVKIFHYKCKGT